MNNIFRFTVDATLGNGMHEKQCAATCTKIRRNEQNLGLHIFSVYPIF